MTLHRVGLLLVSLPQVFAGAWAIAAPANWHESFPGGGREWVTPLGTFNEHLVIDAGGGLFATAVMLILAAIWLERRLVQAALIAWLCLAVPHTIWHAANLGPYQTSDAVLNMLSLGATVVIPLALLVTSGRVPLARKEAV